MLAITKGVARFQGWLGDLESLISISSKSVNNIKSSNSNNDINNTSTNKGRSGSSKSSSGDVVVAEQMLHITSHRSHRALLWTPDLDRRANVRDNRMLTSFEVTSRLQGGRADAIKGRPMFLPSGQRSAVGAHGTYEAAPEHEAGVQSREPMLPSVSKLSGHRPQTVQHRIKQSKVIITDASVVFLFASI